MRANVIAAHMADMHFRPTQGDPAAARTVYRVMLEGSMSTPELIRHTVMFHNQKHEEAFAADDPDMMGVYHTHSHPWEV